MLAAVLDDVELVEVCVVGSAVPVDALAVP